MPSSAMQNATDASTERRGGRYPLVVAPALFERATVDPRYTDACERGDIVPTPIIRGERNMGIFRKRPLEVEAFQWTAGPDQLEDPEWICAAIRDGRVSIVDIGPEVRMEITTLEGVMVARPGDWVIKGTAGELYPCKPEIFAAIYEPADG